MLKSVPVCKKKPPRPEVRIRTVSSFCFRGMWYDYGCCVNDTEAEAQKGNAFEKMKSGFTSFGEKIGAGFKDLGAKVCGIIYFSAPTAGRRQPTQSARFWLLQIKIGQNNNKNNIDQLHDEDEDAVVAAE